MDILQMYLKPGLLLNCKHLVLAKEIFQNTGTGVTSEDKHHLGSSISSQSFITEYVNAKVESSTTSLQTLSNIGNAHLHMAYCAYIHDLANKWTCFVERFQMFLIYSIL